MDEVVLDGKTYVASKKAASECGYAQDYVGQLCRKGFIEARRVSGQWYVQLDSLKAYKDKAETFKPEPPKYQPDPSVEASVTVEGKEYVSAARAAKAAEYNQDYIAQLARAGKVPSKQMGNRWYVELESLLKHRKEKDAMLRAVQAESVGLHRPQQKIGMSVPAEPFIKKVDEPLMSYSSESKPLFPEIAESVALRAVPDTKSEDMPIIGPTSRIPIKVLHPLKIQAQDVLATISESSRDRNTVSVPRKAIFQATSLRLAFSIVLLMAVGLSAYKKDTIFAVVGNVFQTSQTASVGSISDRSAEIIEQILTKEIVYERK